MQSPTTQMKESQPERLEYSTEGGPELGEGLHEIETSLRMNLKTGVAFVERHQPSSDEGGEALGTFRATLPADVAARLSDALAKTDFAALPASTSGGPGTSLIRIRITRGDQATVAQFSSRDVEILDKLDALVSTLDEIVGLTTEHPFQAIQLSLAHKPAPAGVVFAITVKNVGLEPVAIPDLRSLGRADAATEARLGVRVALFPPERPGYTAPPLEWHDVGLPPDAGGHDRPDVLAPGAVRVIETAAWKPAEPGQRHLAQAVFSFYQGPPVVNGHLMARGRALSGAIELVPR